jgi:predicted aspartyl protease
VRLFAASLAALMLAATSPARAHDTAAALLAKHKAFVGWQFGDGTFTSLVLAGKSVYIDKNGTMRTVGPNHYLSLGTAFRTSWFGPETHTGYQQGFTGRIYWATDENGFTHPELGDVTKYNTSLALLRNEATTEMTAVARAPAEIGGLAVDVVRVSDPDADPIDLYVDPQSGAYRRAVIDPGGGLYETTINILAYMDALPGKKIISKYSFGDPAAGYVQWTEAHANVEVTAEELHPPPPRAYWTFGSGAPVPVKLTDNRIYVKAMVNGVEGNFIFDTGDGSGILLTQQFADRAHVRAAGSTVGIGIGGTATESIGRIDTLTIGDSTLHRLTAESQYLGYRWAEEPGTGFAPDGIVGFDLLAGAVVTLNLDAGTLSVQDPATADVDESKGLVATVDLSSGSPLVPMKIDNVEVNATLDTGDAASVLYSPDLRTKYGVRTMVSSRGSYIGGIGGYSSAACGTIDDISLGPIIYKDVDACETQEWTGREILVGIDFLRHFNYIFDYPQAKIVIIPRAGE